MTITKPELIEILKLKAFHITKAYEAANISRRVYYKWINEDEQFKQDVADAKESLKDRAEDTLQALMHGIPILDTDGKLKGWKQRPDTAALIFYLKTQCKDRGYIEKEQREIVSDNRIIVEYIDGSKNTINDALPSPTDDIRQLEAVQCNQLRSADWQDIPVD